MADKDEGLKIVADGKTYEDDPLGFCVQIYEESTERIDELRKDNVENHEFYQGFDKRLEDRANDKRVVRSNLFVHQLTPAIDSRIGGVVSKLEERECPVTVKSSTKNDIPDEEAENITEREVDLNNQLRDTGYIADIFREQILAAEIYRTPSAVKVGWSSSSVLSPVREEPEFSLLSALFGRGQGEPTVRWKYKETGTPFAEWLRPEEFLYQPNVSVFQRDSSYAGHRMWLEDWELMDQAKEFDWDTAEIDAWFDARGTAEDGSTPIGSNNIKQVIGDQVEADKGTPYERGYKDGKNLVVEWYILTYNNAGQERMKQVVVLGNKHILKNGDSPYKGLRFPFFPVVSNRELGSMENMSSIEKGKTAQRLYNESFNSYLDGISYRIFPPFKKRTGTKFAKKPIYGPGEIWSLTDPEDLVPVISNPGELPDLPALMNAIEAMIRNTIGEPDFNEGVAGAQYEKATKTRLRAAGAQRRSAPILKQYGMVIVGVSKAYIALNQQYMDNGVEWVIDVNVDVPSLTGVSDPEQDKQDVLLLYSQMLQDPMFQSPAGRRQLRTAWEEVVRTFKKNDADKFTFTIEDLENDIKVATQVQEAQINKQSASEQLQFEQAAAQSPQPTER